MVGVELKRLFAKVEGESVLMWPIFFIGVSRNCYIEGVFVLPIGNSKCSTTYVVVRSVVTCSHTHFLT